MEIENKVAVRDRKVIYRENDKLIKLFDTTYSKSDILNEALNQARVEETDLLIPKLQEVTKIDGKWAIIMDFVEGKTLEQLIEENPNKLDKYLDLFVETQMKIHSQKAPLLTKLADKMNRKIEETKLSSTIKFDLHSRVEGFSKHDKVLHGDYALSNVIMGKDGVYVVDWAHATQGNASADVAMSYLIFMLDGKEELGEKYIELYAKKSGTDVHYIKSWISVVAASYLPKCEAKYKEKLLQFVNVIDFQ